MLQKISKSAEGAMQTYGVFLEKNCIQGSSSIFSEVSDALASWKTPKAHSMHSVKPPILVKSIGKCRRKVRHSIHFQQDWIWCDSPETAWRWHGRNTKSSALTWSSSVSVFRWCLVTFSFRSALPPSKKNSHSTAANLKKFIYSLS